MLRDAMGSSTRALVITEGLLVYPALFPEPDPRKLGKQPWSGVVLLERPQ